MNKLTIYRNISWQTLYQILANGLGFIFGIVLARFVSQFQFGVYSYVFSLLTIASLFLELGLPTHFWRKWSTDTSNLSDDFRVYVSTRLAIAVPVSIFLLFYVFLIDRFVSLEFLLAYAYFLLDLFVQPSRLFFSSQNQYEKSFAIDSIERIVSLGLGIILLLNHQSLRVIFVGFIVGRMISILICFLLNRKFRPPFFTIRHILPTLKLSIPLFFIGLFATLYYRVDTVMIRYVLGISNVGIYSAAYRLLDASALIPGIITTATLPSVTKLFHMGENEKLHRLFSAMVVYLSIPSFFIAVAGSLYSRNLITLIYGPSFSGSVPILQLLCWNSILLFVTYPVTHFLIANHQEKYYMKALLFLTILNITLNVILLPKIGINGAAIATIISEGVALLLLYPKTKIRISYLPILKVILAISVSALIVAFLPTPWYINVIVLGLIYSVFLLLFRTVKINELLLHRTVPTYD